MLAPRRVGARNSVNREVIVSDAPDAASSRASAATVRGEYQSGRGASAKLDTKVDSFRPRRVRPVVPVMPVLPQGEVSAKIQRFLAERRPKTPCVIVDVDIVEANYRALTEAMPQQGRTYYAVKANPAREILARLRDLGSCFDVASPGEIELCLSVGIGGDRISYGNTIKKERDIAFARSRGVRLFAADSISELQKIARAAPGSDVFVRLLWQCGGAEWPLSRKFGCSPKMAADLLIKARDLGLNPRGVSFHVGSQQTDLTQYDQAIAEVARVFAVVEAEGITLDLVNIGGGFPARYRTDVAPIVAYGRVVDAALARHFPGRTMSLIMEPGRSMVGDAGVIAAEVVLISRKDDDDPVRWVYLDVGKFSGLAETMDEAIKYRLRTPRDGGPTGPVVLAGPTCDSADILYEKFNYELPLDLAEGDQILLLSTGAYTTTYSSVAFNGFRPLKDYCI